MTGEWKSRLPDYVDGSLSPPDAASMRAFLETDAGARREYDRLRAVSDLLDTSLDVEPPADLVYTVVEAIRADVARRERKRIPAVAENALVLAGVAALALLMAQLGRVVDPTDFVGRVTVAAAQGLSDASDALVSLAASWAQLDSIARVLGTLSSTGQTVLAASSGPIVGMSLWVAALLTAIGFAVFRSSRFTKGGLGHVRLLF